MKIMIAGGTGFIGSRLVEYFKKAENKIFILTRQPKRYQGDANLQYVEWLNPGSQPEMQIEQVDVCINLAGESLNSGRWTTEKKRSILESRISTTREFIRIMGALKNKPDVYLNASAVGYYGTSFEHIFTENTIMPGRDFLAEVCDVWEAEAREAEELGIRSIQTRFGLILDRNKGVLPMLSLPYQLMFGGKMGSGEQWMSWIHIRDIMLAFDYLIKNEAIEGPVNLTAPNPKRNKDFGKILSRAIKRPHWLPVPGAPVRGVLGEMSNLVLKGQYVLPKKLEDHGYTFKYAQLSDALENIYN